MCKETKDERPRRVLTPWGNFVVGVRMYKKMATVICTTLESDLVKAVVDKVVNDVAKLAQDYEKLEEDMTNDPNFSVELPEEKEPEQEPAQPV